MKMICHWPIEVWVELPMPLLRQSMEVMEKSNAL